MTERARVKFCGMTRRDDVVMAGELGADAVGFIFWEGSPRYIAPLTARELLRDVAVGSDRVGVFVNASVDEIRRIVDEVRLDVVQLHGDEDPELAADLGGRVVKALGRRSADLVREAGRWPLDVLLLVDAIDPARHGGTGELADWAAARELAALRPIALAGGLTPQNVERAVATVRPYAVDVASGVEQAPGVKDHARMREFMQAVERAGRLDHEHVRAD